VQIIYLPDWLTILSFIIIWPLMQVSIAFLGNKIDDKHFDPNSWWLKTRRWEKNGDFYDDVFKIKKWKHILPDGAKTHKGGFPKGHLQSYDPDYLKAFIAETGRAEIFHVLQILPFWVFGLWSPPFAIWIMLGYAIIVNVPCILAQRYNRPKLIKIYEWANRQKQSNSNKKEGVHNDNS